MNTFTKVLILGVFMLASLKGISQGHLAPVESVFDMPEWEVAYYIKVRMILFEGLDDSPEIRYLVMHSFKPEAVLQIDMDKNQKYYLTYHVAENSIWYSENKDSIQVLKYKKEIDLSSVATIKGLFTAALNKVSSPERLILGDDGINYFFSAWNFGVKSGTIWSPNEASTMGALVAISDQLIELAKGEGTLVTFTPKFTNTIKALTQRIEHK